MIFVKSLALTGLAFAILSAPVLAQDKTTQSVTINKSAIDPTTIPGASVTTTAPDTAQAPAEQAMMNIPLREQIKMRLEMLKGELNLQSGQTRAFESYATALHDVGTKMEFYQAELVAKGVGSTAPEKYELQLKMMESHLKDMKALKNKLQSFYKVLTPEQKLIADQILVVPQT